MAGKEKESKEVAEGLPKVVRDLGITIHHVLRYALTGVITVAVFAFTSVDHQEGEQAKHAMAALGSGGQILLMLAIGVIVYVMSRQILITHFAIYVAHRIRTLKWIGIGKWFGTFFGRGKLRQEYLADHFQTGLHDSEAAYFILRSTGSAEKGEIWGKEIQEPIFHQHSENHVVYAASLIFLAAFLKLSIIDGIVRCNLPEVAVNLFLCLIAGLCCLLFATYADFQLFQREAALLARFLVTEDARRVLTEVGLCEAKKGVEPTQRTEPRSVEVLSETQASLISEKQ